MVLTYVYLWGWDAIQVGIRALGRLPPGARACDMTPKNKEWAAIRRGMLFFDIYRRVGDMVLWLGGVPRSQCAVC